MEKKKILWVVDSTLRDGGQAPGIAFSKGEKQAIAAILSNIGIQEMEIGIPAMGSDEQEDIRALYDLNLPIRKTCWCRAKMEDISDALKCGANSIHISFPVSPILMKISHTDKEEILSKLKILLKFAINNFEYVTIGAQDATRSQFKFLVNFCNLAFKYGASRIRIADTIGMLNPMQSTNLFKKLRKAGVCGNLEFHGHNDLGMAVGNTIAALDGGCDAVSATVNGLGERAGNTALEEIIMASKCTLNSMETPFDTKLLAELSSLVERASRRTLAVDKPIVGKMIFSHESGIHVHGLLENKNSYERFQAELVGHKKSNFVFGTHSGRTMIRKCLAGQGVKINEKEIAIFLGEVKKQAQINKNPMTEEDILSLYKNLSFPEIKKIIHLGPMVEYNENYN